MIKHHGCLQAKTGALHPETLRLLYDFARLKTDAAEQHAVANSLRSPLTPEQPCQRRGAKFARLRMEAHWEALGCALCLLTTRAISRTGPVWGRGFGPGSRRPRARVPLVVWAWDLLLSGFRPVCYAASLLRSPGPCLPAVFRSAICDCL